MKPIDRCTTSTDFNLNSASHVSKLAVDDGSIESFDLALAQLQHRADAKTSVLEESFLRAESAQRRFWGINE